MIYSRFNDKLGLYEVFADDRGHALNSDYPTPKFGRDAGGIGVPATEAGRELPQGVRRIGSNWHARGLVVTPSGSSGSALSGAVADAARGYALPAALLAAGIVAGLWLSPRIMGAG